MGSALRPRKHFSIQYILRFFLLSRSVTFLRRSFSLGPPFSTGQPPHFGDRYTGPAPSTAPALPQAHASASLNTVTRLGSISDTDESNGSSAARQIARRMRPMTLSPHPLNSSTAAERRRPLGPPSTGRQWKTGKLWTNDTTTASHGLVRCSLTLTAAW